VTADTSRRDRRNARSPTVPRRGQVQAFLRLFKGNDRVLILINPDPDSMASALAVKRLLWKRAKRVVIAYIGEIRRLENLAMVDLLRIPMVKIEKVDPERFACRILVDSQPYHSETFKRFTYDAIIDHHPKAGNWNAPYVDIRPEYGATATILLEYLREAGVKPSMKLATALLYAIKTDTANFERDATEEDARQFRYLFRYANMNRLQKIEKSELRVADLRHFQTALDNRTIRKNRIYAHVNQIPSPDICVQIADFFMRVYGIGWSFVSGVCGDKLIIIIRNDGYRKDAGRLATVAFGAFGSAGGHRGAARAEIDIDALCQKGIRPDDADLEAFVRERLSFGGVSPFDSV
jgi:nanoRNase/pAp phosphatase (c-di-AMP/oligoRNAs hydrolase)